jgi:hypothetical protein
VTLEHFILAAITGLLVGFSKGGVTGVINIVGPALAVLVHAKFAIGVPLPLFVLGDCFALWRFGGHWEWRVVRPMLPAALLGVVLGGWLLGGLVTHLALFNRTLGVIALFFCLFQLWLESRNAKRPPDHPHQPATPIVGAAAGLTTGVLSTVANQGGLVTNLYLISQRLAKERFMATQAMLYVFINSTKLAPFVWRGLITRQTLALDLFAAPFVIAGGFLGARVMRALNEPLFVRIVLWLTLATGLLLVVRG